MHEYEISTLENAEIIITDKVVYTESFKESSEIYIIEISNDEIIKKYKISGEEFNIYADGENIIISHPRWSISGIGKSLIDAERNLFHEAQNIYHHYISYSNHELTEDAIKMKSFLQRIV